MDSARSIPDICHFFYTGKIIKIRALGEASFKKNWFFSEFIRKGGGISPNPKFPNQKKIEIFLDFFAERGGGLTQSKISVIRNCLFFFGNGGGSFPIQNFLIRKN